MVVGGSCQGYDGGNGTYGRPQRLGVTEGEEAALMSGRVERGGGGGGGRAGAVTSTAVDCGGAAATTSSSSGGRGGDGGDGGGGRDGSPAAAAGGESGVLRSRGGGCLCARSGGAQRRSSDFFRVAGSNGGAVAPEADGRSRVFRGNGGGGAAAAATGYTLPAAAGRSLMEEAAARTSSAAGAGLGPDSVSAAAMSNGGGGGVGVQVPMHHHHPHHHHSAIATAAAAATGTGMGVLGVVNPSAAMAPPGRHHLAPAPVAAVAAMEALTRGRRRRTGMGGPCIGFATRARGVQYAPQCTVCIQLRLWRAWFCVFLVCLMLLSLNSILTSRARPSIAVTSRAGYGGRCSGKRDEAMRQLQALQRQEGEGNQHLFLKSDVKGDHNLLVENDSKHTKRWRRGVTPKKEKAIVVLPRAIDGPRPFTWNSNEDKDEDNDDSEDNIKNDNPRGSAWTMTRGQSSNWDVRDGRGGGKEDDDEEEEEEEEERGGGGGGGRGGGRRELWQRQDGNGGDGLKEGKVGGGKVVVALELQVEVGRPQSVTGDHFLCATLDWWPPDKCSYGRCSWGNASILNLDLSSKRLLKVVSALSPLVLRIGGTLEDRIVYDMRGGEEKGGRKEGGGRDDEDGRNCPQLKRDPSHRSGYTKGCLTKRRWDDINAFSKRAGCKLVFGLNALSGRDGCSRDCAQQERQRWGRRPGVRKAEGSWDPSNARSLLEYTSRQGYEIWAWELGNELSGRQAIVSKVSAKQYAEDVRRLRELINELWSSPKSDDHSRSDGEPEGGPGVRNSTDDGSPTDPRGGPIYTSSEEEAKRNGTPIVHQLSALRQQEGRELIGSQSWYNRGRRGGEGGGGSGGEEFLKDAKFLVDFASLTSPDIIDGVSYHSYDLGAGNDPKLAEKVMSAAKASAMAASAQAVGFQVKANAPWAQLWQGETGGAYNSGQAGVTDTFMSAFWYLNYTAATAANGHNAFCRQTLVGGNYGLLEVGTFDPNPDYYAALLWRRLMGTQALAVRTMTAIAKSSRAMEMTATNTDMSAGNTAGGTAGGEGGGGGGAVGGGGGGGKGKSFDDLKAYAHCHHNSSWNRKGTIESRNEASGSRSETSWNRNGPIGNPNETSSRRDETSWNRDKTSWDRDETSWDRDETCGDREETSRDRDETSGDRDETSRDRDETTRRSFLTSGHSQLQDWERLSDRSGANAENNKEEEDDKAEESEEEEGEEEEEEEEEDKEEGEVLGAFLNPDRPADVIYPITTKRRKTTKQRKGGRRRMRRRRRRRRLEPS
ncbi:hypothetical protein CBR_g2938 [Chara braunii]|uniref:Uncharacterized protein n=1 Tax=Chara braunii TaxID=69332 RepID=A0A388KEB0_CHABU|nr:hypothetical protein CBR_g2938 [Chara braunii]|eukprot:GBG68394.1 hypothetical protein CBR_g2938 [Chara braunii]